jgi:hypothetical protein
MKTAKRRKTIPPLPTDATNEQIIRWATKYDAFDRLDAGVSEIVEDHSDLDELLDAAISQENTEQINIRIPVALKVLLTKLARERATEASTLGRIWLAERIRQELRK